MRGSRIVRWAALGCAAAAAVALAQVQTKDSQAANVEGEPSALTIRHIIACAHEAF